MSIAPADEAIEQHETGLRERRRRETAAEIADAALALFEANGVDATTVEDIARRAGVSARTCFRYFASKERMVLDLHHHFDDAIEAWLRGLAPGAPLLAQLEQVFREAVRRIDDDVDEVRDRVLRVRRLIRSEPGLHTAAHALDAEHAEQIATRVCERFGDSEQMLDAQLATELARAALGVAFDRWARAAEAGGTPSLGAIYDDVAARLRVLAAG